MKVIKYTLIIILFSLSFHAKSQLHGTYTIGKSGSENYSTIMSAVIDCYFKGTSSAVTFKISPGIYSEQIIIPYFFGPQVSAPVTFEAANGDSTSVIIKYKPTTDSMNFTLLVDAAEYIVFRKLSFTTDTISGRLIEISKWCTGIQFYNCRFLGWKNGAELIYSPNETGTNNTYSIFGNNIFLYGSYGIYMWGNEFQPDVYTYIQKNQFISQKTNAVFLKNHFQPVISGNLIYSKANPNNFDGIFLDQCSGKGQVSENRIFMLQSTTPHYGIRLNKTSGLNQNEFLISNNFIAATTDNFSVGIYLLGTSDIKIYHNSIQINGDGQGCIPLSLIFPKYTIIKNNIFSNKTDGYSMEITNAVSMEIDYNAYFAKGQYFVNIDNIPFNSLKVWQDSSGMDKNSILTDPQFCNDTLLYTFNIALNGKGTVITQVSKDIDLETRANPPDIGADEFNPLTFDLPFEADVCANNFTEIDAGAGWDSYLWPDLSNQRKYLFLPAENIDKTLYIKATVTKKGCFFSDSVKINQHKYPVFSLGNDTQFCFQHFTTFKLKAPAGFSKYLWQNNSNDSIFTVSKPADSGLKVFWVKITDKFGCENKDSIQIYFFDCSSLQELLSGITVWNSNSANMIYINFGNQILQKDLKIDLISLHGHLISENNMNYINTGGLPKGIYFVRISSPDCISVKKVVIE